MIILPKLWGRLSATAAACVNSSAHLDRWSRRTMLLPANHRVHKINIWQEESWHLTLVQSTNSQWPMSEPYQKESFFSWARSSSNEISSSSASTFSISWPVFGCNSKCARPYSSIFNSQATSKWLYDDCFRSVSQQWQITPIQATCNPKKLSTRTANQPKPSEHN